MQVYIIHLASVARKHPALVNAPNAVLHSHVQVLANRLTAAILNAKYDWQENVRIPRGKGAIISYLHGVSRLGEDK